jgi:hypothetical protein
MDNSWYLVLAYTFTTLTLALHIVDTACEYQEKSWNYLALRIVLLVVILITDTCLIIYVQKSQGLALWTLLEISILLNLSLGVSFSQKTRILHC